MKCNKCSKDNNYFVEARYLYPSEGIEGQDPGVLFFCDDKCRDEWEASDCGKNYDMQRLKAIEDFIKENKQKWKNDGWTEEEWESHGGNDIWPKEVKKIRQKWNIEEKQPQEREREKNCQFKGWNSAIRSNY